MAKFCVNCGQEVPAGNNVCTNCGTPVNGGNTTVVVNNTQPTQSNGFALAGFIVSLVSTFLCCGSLNTISLILSIVGLVKAKDYSGAGKGLAIAGIVISAIVIVISIILVILGYGAALFEELA